MSSFDQGTIELMRLASTASITGYLYKTHGMRMRDMELPVFCAGAAPPPMPLVQPRAQAAGDWRTGTAAALSRPRAPSMPMRGGARNHVARGGARISFCGARAMPRALRGDR